MKIRFALLFLSSLPIYCDMQIGVNYTHVNMQVENQLSFDGNLGGMQGSYEYQPCNSFYGAIRVAWKQGHMDSSGASRSLLYIDVQERMGYTASYNQWLLSLFSGYGYKHLGQDLKQNNQPSVTFNYNEFYIPLGLLSSYDFNAKFAIGLNAIWMPQVFPTVKIAPLKGARWILTSTYSNILIELPLTFYLDSCQRYALIFKPSYEHWSDGKSTAKTASGSALNLPANHYHFWGAELNFALSF